MFTWNLPALIRNVVLLGIVCIFLNWNFWAWFLILFVWFVEMDEELTKFENYTDFHMDQISLYDFDKNRVAAYGWNLEEQLRIFNHQHPEVVQQYQKTFRTRIQELRKHPTTAKLRKDLKKQNPRSKSKKQEMELKQEVFGYTENYWDEQERDGLPTNEYVEVMDHLACNSMYEWYHQNGLVVPESEYGIKTMCLYHDKYTDTEGHSQCSIMEHEYDSYVYNSWAFKHSKHKNTSLYFRKQAEGSPKVYNNLLYWHMSDYQRALYNQPCTTQKNNKHHKDIRINYVHHMEDLAYKSSTQWKADLIEIAKLQSMGIKIPQRELWIKTYSHKRKRYYMQKIFIK